MRLVRNTLIYAQRLLVIGSLFVFFHLDDAVGQPYDTRAYEAVLKRFDPRQLTYDDKRFLQASLAFEGHYNGLLDGDWGGISKRAFSSYSRDEFGGRVENWHMAFLAASFFQNQSENGWAFEFFKSAGISVLFPTKTAISEPPSKNFANWRVAGSSLSISIGILNRKSAQSVHDYTTGWNEVQTPPYSVRKRQLAVTSAVRKDGGLLYTRSDLVGRFWSTVMLSADETDKALLWAMAASIDKGKSRPLRITKGGELDEAISVVLKIIEEAEPQNDSAAKKKIGEKSASSSGTGFYVSEGGYVLTNAHVVDHCSLITVGGKRAAVVNSSPDFDLSLIQVIGATNHAVASFSPSPARLNSDATVAGFPYAGLLDGLNITRGSVSALKGLGGYAGHLQISAPVQPGNSGGPVMASNANIVGVVVSKLDALAVADVMGDIPQNVNFAVRGEIAKLFLSQNHIEPLIGEGNATLNPVELADKARDFTVFIECDK